MAKLNGIHSIGSVVNFRGEASVITDAHTSHYNGSEYHNYTVSPIGGNTEYDNINEREVELVTLKTPLKKHLTKLSSIENKMSKINEKIEIEMKKISKKNGWDKMPYDHYDNDYEWIADGMSASLGLDDLHDEKNELLIEMVQNARKVKAEGSVV